MNEEFDTDEELAEVVKTPAQKAAATRKRNAEAKAAAANLDIDLDTPDEPEKPVAEIDPEDDRKNWPTIRIEMEDSKPNYEYVAAHGTKRNGVSFGHELQIMRGVDVKVPPSIVYALQDSVATHFVQRTDPLTGTQIMDRHDRSAIPWRLVKSGTLLP